MPNPTDLRDRIADAVAPLLLDTLPKVVARARAYEIADAVLVVQPSADQGAEARIRALHRKATHGDDCVHCIAFGPGYDNTWPCQTIRVLYDMPYGAQLRRLRAEEESRG